VDEEAIANTKYFIKGKKIKNKRLNAWTHNLFKKFISFPLINKKKQSIDAKLNAICPSETEKQNQRTRKSPMILIPSEQSNPKSRCSKQE